MASVELTKLKIQPGVGVHMEVADRPDSRLSTKLIGLVAPRSVLVQTPMVDGRPVLFRKDQSLIVRFFANKVACGFRTKVIHLCTTPFHYLHLAYPGRVEVGEVRNAARAQANLPITVINKTNTQIENVHGAIVDISTTGAKIETLQPVAEMGDELLITAKVAVGHITRIVNIEAYARTAIDRFDMANSVAAYGIQFKYLSDVDFLALHAFVNSQLVRNADL
ncbi:flagellar brake protein [Salinispirillum marinum]|uniref:Flagellar brake protein n=2 Tax=Saccharospirillaceae TaxID=255527 RepID=A0ABV8BGL2_9GAMM